VEGRSKEISPRTDVYSLGAILYEILTGRPPHLGETMMEIYGKILHEDPAPPGTLKTGLPQEIQTIALKALEKDPRRRYSNAQDFAEDLSRFLAGEPVLAKPVSLAYRTYRKLIKSPVARGLSIAAVVVLLAAMAIGFAGRDKSRRLEAAREQRLSLLREHARTSLDAVLKLRRAGANDAMREFVPGLEAAYRQAAESDPEVAEVEYLMGRMHRALMEDERALEFQERALRKNRDYAPALYERAILLANRYGSGLTKAVAQARRLPPGPVTAQASRDLHLPDPQEVESGRQELLAVRETILKDCAALGSLPIREGEGSRLRTFGEAHVLTVKGILAFYRLEYAEARKLLEDAVRRDPTLEEAWAALCETAYRQANVEARRSATAADVLRLYVDTEGLYDKAISRDTGYAPHWIGRAETRRHRAFYLMSRGQDALPVFDEAEADLTRALQLAPDFPDAWSQRAAVRQMKAVSRMDRGENPVKDLEAAEQDLGILLSRWGDRPSAWIQKGHLQNERARWQRRSGEDPLPRYAAAEEAFRRAMELDPSDIRSSYDLGVTLMYRGQHIGARGKDPLPDFAAAESRFTEMVRAARHTADPWEKRAQVRHARGLYRLGKGEEPVDDFSQAEEDLTEALRVNPANARVWAERGSARGFLGRLQEKKRAVGEALRSYADAAADFKQAFGLNAALEADYRSECSEAKKRLAELKP
jgi:serine/threonine-protein kinase